MSLSPPIGVHEIPEFALQGYVSDTDHTVTPTPVFSPEMSALRPTAQVSFRASADEFCMGFGVLPGQDGMVAFAPGANVAAAAGQRVFMRIVLYDADEMQSEGRYEIVVACRPDGSDGAISEFYAIATPSGS